MKNIRKHAFKFIFNIVDAFMFGALIFTLGILLSPWLISHGVFDIVIRVLSFMVMGLALFYGLSPDNTDSPTGNTPKDNSRGVGQ